MKNFGCYLHPLLINPLVRIHYFTRGMTGKENSSEVGGHMELDAINPDWLSLCPSKNRASVSAFPT